MLTIIINPANNTTPSTQPNQAWSREAFKTITLPKNPDRGGSPVIATAENIKTEPIKIALGMANPLAKVSLKPPLPREIMSANKNIPAAIKVE